MPTQNIFGFPFLPAVGLGTSAFGRRRRTKKIPTRYAPSLRAKVQRITSQFQPKTPAGGFSGLEIRPIIVSRQTQRKIKPTIKVFTFAKPKKTKKKKKDKKGKFTLNNEIIQNFKLPTAI